MGDSWARKRWDGKHRESLDPCSPAPFLLEVLGTLPRGLCLDLAAGRGGNSLFMAEKGYRVDTVDWSYEAMAMVRDEAHRRGLPVRTWVADLSSYPLPRDRYEVVLCFRFLDRNLWPAMARALRPGGALVMETFTIEHLKRRPDFPVQYCLEPGELRFAFPGLGAEIRRDGPGRDTASLLAFRPACK